MRIAPPDCDTLLPGLNRMTTADAAAALDSLIGGLFDVVEREMPNVDIAPARARYDTLGKG